MLFSALSELCFNLVGITKCKSTLPSTSLVIYDRLACTVSTKKISVTENFANPTGICHSVWSTKPFTHNSTTKQKKIDEWGPFCIFLPALFNILLWYMTFVYVYLKGYSSAFQHNLMHLPHLITTDKILIRPCAEKERKTCILKLNHNENLRAMNSIPSIDIYLKHVEHFLCMYVCM